MSNRMSVLSRRLERFAVTFSVATFVFFLVGFFAAANNKGQLVSLFAGLASVCLFASFFLWLAHGFAWAMIPEESLPARKLVPAKKPAEALEPVEASRPVEALKPIEAMKPVEALKPTEAPKPAEALKPADARMKPAGEMKPAEAKRPVEEKKPAEEQVIAEEDPPDAKYTITGRRIY